MAWRGNYLTGYTRHGMVGLDQAWRDAARRGKTWNCFIEHDVAAPGMAWLGKAWWGRTRHGMAWSDYIIEYHRLS